MKESEIQNQICEYLAWKKIFFWRNNSIPSVFYKKDGSMQFRRMPKWSMNGTPDLIAVIDGKFIGIEIKAQKGIQSIQQKDFEKKVNAAGGYYYLVRSLDELIKCPFISKI